MPAIMCTRALWSAIGGRGPLPQRETAVDRRCRLQAWCARELFTPVGPVVVALEETTYLTLVFPLFPLPDFNAAFAAALASQLSVLDVPEAAVEAEVEAIVHRARFAKNDNRSLLGSVNDVAFHVIAELGGSRRLSPDVIERAQTRLNGMPHVHREPSFPDQATTLLFRQSDSIQ